jgi:hypothetical protein
MRNVYRRLDEKSKGGEAHGNPTRRQEDIIKMDFRETGSEGVD